MTFLIQLNIHGYNILTIFWNIFLALLPCLTVYYLAKSVGKKKFKQFKIIEIVAFILIFLFWFFFFPNTAYLFADIRHLVDYCTDWDAYRVCKEETWMVFFFFTYALAGVPTLYYALKKMSVLLGNVFFDKLRIIFPLIMIPLTSIGVMFGLWERFNSWNIINQPLSLFKTGFSYFTDATLFFNFFILTICMYIIYYGVGIFINYLKNN